MIIRRGEPISQRNVSNNFKASEFFCKCNLCQDQIIHATLIHRMQLLRDKIARPIVINSAFRCPRHNKDVGGAPKSQHLLGRAVDIIVGGMLPIEIARIAYRLGFSGIGVATNFTHLDVRHLHPNQNVNLFVYKGVDLNQVHKAILKGD
jgi:hypothetical protein